MVNIRLATIEDATELHNMCLLFNSSETATTRQAIESYLQNSNVIIMLAEVAHEPVGFICGTVAHHLSFATPIGDITEIFVKSEHRRTSVAKKLFTALEQEFIKQDVMRFRVFTTADNEKAIKFYQSRDFHRYDTVMFRKNV